MFENTWRIEAVAIELNSVCFDHATANHARESTSLRTELLCFFIE